MSNITVKTLCDKYHIKPKHLSERFGVSSRTLSAWNAGRSNPLTYVLEMMDEILSFAPERKVPNTEMTIRELSKDYGWTLARLSDRFHIPLRTVENWSAGSRNPPPYLIGMMKEILDHEHRNVVTHTVEITVDLKHARSMLELSGFFEARKASPDEVFAEVLNLLDCYGTTYKIADVAAN